MRDILGIMDRAEAFLIDAMNSSGSSTFFGFAYAIFFSFKKRFVEEKVIDSSESVFSADT